MKIRAWSEHRDQRVIQTGDGHVVASKDDTVIIIVARKGEPVYSKLDEIMAWATELVE